MSGRQRYSDDEFDRALRGRTERGRGRAAASASVRHPPMVTCTRTIEANAEREPIPARARPLNPYSLATHFPAGCSSVDGHLASHGATAPVGLLARPPDVRPVSYAIDRIASLSATPSTAPIEVDGVGDRCGFWSMASATGAVFVVTGAGDRRAAASRGGRG